MRRIWRLNWIGCKDDWLSCGNRSWWCWNIWWWNHGRRWPIRIKWTRNIWRQRRNWESRRYSLNSRWSRWHNRNQRMRIPSHRHGNRHRHGQRHGHRHRHGDFQSDAVMVKDIGQTRHTKHRKVWCIRARRMKFFTSQHKLQKKTLTFLLQASWFVFSVWLVYLNCDRALQLYVYEDSSRYSDTFRILSHRYDH